MPEARPFSRATLGGNPVGRPRTAAPDPGTVAKALIAAQTWQSKRAASIASAVPVQRSISSGGEISARRGEQRRERRFEGEGGPRRGLTGGATNPWS